MNNPDLKLKDSESGESLGLNELQINRNLLYESSKWKIAMDEKSVQKLDNYSGIIFHEREEAPL